MFRAALAADTVSGSINYEESQSTKKKINKKEQQLKVESIKGAGGGGGGRQAGRQAVGAVRRTRLAGWLAGRQTVAAGLDTLNFDRLHLIMYTSRSRNKLQPSTV